MSTRSFVSLCSRSSRRTRASVTVVMPEQEEGLEEKHLKKALNK